MRVHRWVSRAFVMSLSALVAATSVAALPASADGPINRDARKPDTQVEKKVDLKESEGLREDQRQPIQSSSKPIGEVRWPAAGQAEVAAAPEFRTAGAGTAAVQVSRAEGGKLKVETFDQDLSTKAGLAGVLLKVSDATAGKAAGKVSVRLDYSGFQDAYGGDYASRLRLVRMPDCVLSTPDKPECRVGTPVLTENNVKAKTLTSKAPIERADAGSMVLAAAAGPGGPGGQFTASSMSPAGSWSAGGSSGDFSYSYPLRLPGSVGGQAPQAALGYSSGAVDGRTTSTNNQASAVGDGWDLSGAGFIERRYKACADDRDKGNNESRNTLDLCWATDNATIQLAGVSSELVRIPGTPPGVDQWRAKNDDGTKVERLVNGPHDNGDNNRESWKVTTPDGTQYFLGSRPKAEGSTWTVPVFGNHSTDDCWKPTGYSDSWCMQAWRWLVDYVVDPKGNVTRFYYNVETNKYGRDMDAGKATTYDRAGSLSRIDYGLRDTDINAPAPARILFTQVERCLPDAGFACNADQLTKDTAKRWPDTPFDQICTGARCENQYAPTFFSRLRLTKIVTQVRTGDPGTTQWRDVDRWDLRHTFPETGDGLSPALWLDGVKHTGVVNPDPGKHVSLPETQFSRRGYDNRVDALEGQPPMVRGRIDRILHDSGGITQVDYYEQDCKAGVRMPDPNRPDLNTMRCFPTYWTPLGAPDPQLHWFHKYVVRAVIEDDRVRHINTQIKTYYEYPDGGAWHYDSNDFAKPELRTWSEWRGYNRVRTIKGDPSEPDRMVSDTVYLRGMDGDKQRKDGNDKKAEGTPRDEWVGTGENRIEDHERLKGFQRESTVFNGDTTVSVSVNDPWLKETVSNGANKAYLLNTQAVRGKTFIKDDTWRSTKATTTFNDRGQAVLVDDEGDTAVGDDEKCVFTEYAPNEDAWLLSYSKRVLTYAGRCLPLAQQQPATDKIISDSLSQYDNREYGQSPVKGNVTGVKRWNGTGYSLLSTTEYDDYGRVKKTTDAATGVTTTTHEPAAGFPVKQVSTTNAKGHTETTIYEPANGQPVAQIGPNGERTDAEYDSLGRLVKTWLPTRPRNLGPNAEYVYTYDQNTATNVIASKALREDGQYNTSYQIMDGLLRPRQTQTPAPDGGQLLTDTFYESRGMVSKANGAYFNTSAPDGKLWLPKLDNQVPNQTKSTYDKLGRPTEVTYIKLDVPQWSTKSTYTGDTVTVTPPTGQTATTAVTDVHGRETERITLGSTPESTKKQYDAKGLLKKVTDPAGNVWTFDYDSMGRKKTAVDPDQGTSNFKYNDLDQLVESTDGRGRKLAYTYDELGRKSAVFENSTSGFKLAEWKYDSLKKGLPDSSTRYVKAPDGTPIPYTQKVTKYDEFSRVKETAVVIPSAEDELGKPVNAQDTGKSYKFTQQYTATLGLPLSVTTPAAGGLAAETLITDYDELGAPKATRGLQTYAQEHIYSKFGETLRLTIGRDDDKQLWLTNYFEEGTRRLEQSIVDRSKVDDYRVANRTFGYDQGGNITRIADQPTAGKADVQCFQYDNLRRLNKAFTPNDGNCATTPDRAVLDGAAPYGFEFGYDKAGNRVSEKRYSAQGNIQRTYKYDSANQPHAVRSVEQSSQAGTAKDEFGYDLAGNTTSRKVLGNTQTLDWDVEGRLASVTEASGKKSSYLYDADGSRLLKKEAGRTTLYLPHGMELVLDTATKVVSGKRYYSHAGTTVAVRYSGSTNVSFMVSDHQGTPTAIVNSADLAYTRQYYDPFGGARGAKPPLWADDKGFIGGSKDDTGLTHLGAREYDPATGKFISDDAVMNTSDSQQISGYSYSNNNPVNFSDPSGMYLEGGVGEDGNSYGIDKERNVLVGNWPGGDESAAQAYPGAYNKRKTAKQQAQRSQQARYAAAAAAGMSPDQYEEYVRTAGQPTTWWDVVVAEIPDLLMDLTGLGDIRDCFTKGDIMACVSLVPWAKVFKLVKAVTRIYKAISKANGVMNKIKEARRELKKVDEAAEDMLQSCPLRHSFVPGTKVLMADGSTKSIEDIKTGELVKATDPGTGKSASREVVRTIIGGGQKNMVELTTSDGGKIVATDGHPFWVPALKKWVRADQLPTNSMLQTSADTWVQVVQTQKWTAQQRVHNLTVDVDHTYYVVAGGQNVLTHNCGGAYPGHDADCTCNGGELYHRLGPDDPEYRTLRGKEHPQSVRVANLIEESGELWGADPRLGMGTGGPTVQAYPGPLPDGKSGIEFRTPVVPDGRRENPITSWSGDREGVEHFTADGTDYAKIEVHVTKNTQRRR